MSRRNNRRHVLTREENARRSAAANGKDPDKAVDSLYRYTPPKLIDPDSRAGRQDSLKAKKLRREIEDLKSKLHELNQTKSRRSQLNKLLIDLPHLSRDSLSKSNQYFFDELSQARSKQAQIEEEILGVENAIKNATEGPDLNLSASIVKEREIAETYLEVLRKKQSKNNKALKRYTGALLRCLGSADQLSDIASRIRSTKDRLEGKKAALKKHLKGRPTPPRTSVSGGAVNPR